MAATKGTVSAFVLVIILFCGASLGKSPLTKAVRFNLDVYSCVTARFTFHVYLADFRHGENNKLN